MPLRLVPRGKAHMSISLPKLGLIVNPVAGLGGAVGLKGSDGESTQRQALAMGARPRAPERAIKALRRLAAIDSPFELLTCTGRMGGEEAAACGLEFTVLEGPSGVTTPRHTRDAARAMAEQGVDLLLFAGGDGTACDICEAVGDRLMVLGIPAGVKIHSGVYAISPDAAGRLAAEFVQGRSFESMEAEVMDQDEEALRKGRVSVRLHGYLHIPRHRALTQGTKSSSAVGESVAARIAAADVVRKMEAGRTYIIGPGTTTREVMAALGLAGTLVGVDVVRDGQLLVKDAGEEQILELVRGRDAAIVVTVIGGQGYLFGRGNQQISARVIREVGTDNIIVVATRQKLNSLRWRGLLVDTGDDEVDTMLGGYVRIVTGTGEQALCKVGDPDLDVQVPIEPPGSDD